MYIPSASSQDFSAEVAKKNGLLQSSESYSNIATIQKEGNYM